jgi:hypothetical protein
MTKVSSVTGADANGASPDRRPPLIHQIVVVVKRGRQIVVIVKRGRKKQGDGTMRGRRQWKRGDHRREGEEGDGGWDDTRCTKTRRRGYPSTSDGVDARMMRSR